MKTDTLFYRLFQSFPSLFFELIQHSPTEAENYQFASVEVKQLSFRIDGVFLPQGDNPEAPIYFTEVQFQDDGQFYGRFFAETFLYLSKTDLINDWRGVVIYPNRQRESQNTKRYQELLDFGRVQRVYLDELENLLETSPTLATVQLIISEDSQAVARATNLIQRVRQEVDDANQQRELLELIERVLIYKLPHLSRQEIEAMFTLSDWKQTRFYQEAFEEGIEQGIEQGREEGKLELVPFMLKLGTTIEQIAETLQLPLEKVQEAAQKSLQN